LHKMEEMVERSFLWGLAACMALALMGGIVASGRLLRRIESISETSRDIIDGDLKRRVPTGQVDDEIEHLAGSINAMLDRIQSLMEGLHQVTTDIAHDMRTPLTRLRQRLERAQRGDLDGMQLRELLVSTVKEIDITLDIFGALLRIAQIESGARKAAFGKVDLSELLRTVVELYRTDAEEKGQTVYENISGECVVHGDHELLMQLFANLIENAVRHAPDSACLVVSAAEIEERIEVQVTDSGHGIPIEERAKVLQRFYRLESSRTTPGSGLGLSMSLAIVNLHRATLSLSDNEPGLRATVSFRHAV